MPQPPPPGPGRPRSSTAHTAVLDATLELLKSRGVRQLTISAIAEASGVGKPTIYRWWPSKNAIAIEALFGSVTDAVAFSDDGSVTTRLIAQVRAATEILAGPMGRHVAELIGEGQSDPDTLDLIQSLFVAVRRDDARRLIQHGQHLGELDPGADPDVALDLIYGPLYYRLLVRHLPLDPGFAEEAVELALRGLQPRAV